MKKTLRIIVAVILITACFFAFTNPSVDTLKKELPGLVTVSSGELEHLVQVGRTQNSLFFSKFRVQSVSRDGHLKWSKEYLGIANNFYLLEDQPQPAPAIKSKDAVYYADSIKAASDKAKKPAFDPSMPSVPKSGFVPPEANSDR